jgi:hypothetical protein
MTTTFFDTLAYSKRLQEAGFTQLQAETQAEVFAEIIDDKLVTKGDLKKELKALEYRLTNKLTMRLGGMLVAATTLLAVITKL